MEAKPREVEDAILICLWPCHFLGISHTPFRDQEHGSGSRLVWLGWWAETWSIGKQDREVAWLSVSPGMPVTQASVISYWTNLFQINRIFFWQGVFFKIHQSPHKHPACRMLIPLQIHWSVPIWRRFLNLTSWPQPPYLQLQLCSGAVFCWSVHARELRL